MGALGIKDIKLQWIFIATKQIFHALDGNEPWKVFIRNNIKLAIPKQAKAWKLLPLSNLITGNFHVSPMGSSVFKAICKT